MADITMCLNNTCEARSYCYRQQAEPTPKRQSMARFIPVNNVFGERFHCDHFYSMQENYFKNELRQ